MDSLSSVSPSLALPPNNPLCSRRYQQLGFSNSCRFQTRNRRLLSFSGLPSSPGHSRRSSWRRASSKSDGGRTADAHDDDRAEEVERALHLDGTIPGTSDEFVKQVSSRAYDMRRNLQQTFDSSSYDGINIYLYIYIGVCVCVCV